MKNHTCDSSTEIYLLNQYCTNGLHSSGSYECFKYYSSATEIIRHISGAWLVLIGLTGIIGNLATLTVIPYSAKRKRHGLDENFNTTTVFILHLLFIDLLHCFVMVLPQGISYSSNSSPFGWRGCQIILFGGISTFVADMLAISLVALSRCLDMVVKEKWTNFCDKRRNVFMVLLLVWIPSLLTLLHLMIIQVHGIEAGWNCETGGCGFVRSCKLYENTKLFTDVAHRFTQCNDGTDIWRLTYFSTICVPICSLIVIIVSYLVIWYKVHQSTKHFQHDTREMATRLNQRDIKMTRTVLILVVLNFLFWLPYGILTLTSTLTSKPSPSTAEIYILKIISVNIFESQYAINFFIYVARSEQYRNSFLDVLRITGRKLNIIAQSRMKRKEYDEH